jgi:hypothetical protein
MEDTPMAELTEQSTTEDVQEYVEQVVEEVKADRAGEKPEVKSDAQITSEHAENEKPPVVKTEKPAKAEKTAKAEETGEDESWFNDDVKAEAAAYGIEESELADFASREELDRALRLFDKSALAAGRKALAEAETGKDPAKNRNEKGQFAKGAPSKADIEGVIADLPTKQDGRYEIKLSKDVYDDEIVGEFTRMRDHYEARDQALQSRFEALESRFLEADAIAEEKHFDGLVDSLDHADLFGKTGKEDAKQLERRQDLHIQAKALMLGLSQLGRPTELNDALVNRAARMLFAEDFFKKELKNRTRKISKQADGRQGGGATRPQDPREDPREEADRKFKELAQA